MKDLQLEIKSLEDKDSERKYERQIEACNLENENLEKE